MGISLQDVIDNDLVSEDVLNAIPHNCECGAPIEFTDSLRQIYCSNPQCYYKVAARLESMCKKLEAEGWGESTCIAVCRDFKLKSPYQVFQLEKVVKEGYGYTGTSAFEKKVTSICNPELRKVELWKVVELAGIPSIESIAYKIFNGYSTFQEAFKDIEAGQVPFIANKLGLKNSESGVMAVRVFDTLMEYHDEILYGEKQFEIYTPTGDTLYIAITGGVSGFKNKAEFISYITDRYNGKVNAMLMNTVTSQVDMLVVDGDTSSNKFKSAIKINDKYLEKGLENGAISKEDVGKLKDKKDLHAVGEIIFIGDSHEVISRLDSVYGV